MADRKIVEVEETKTETKKSGLNIDLGDLKKVGAAILAFVVSNPDLVSKLVKKPVAYLKKIILGSLTSLGGGNSEISDIFGKISNTVKGAKVAESAGIDVGGILGSLLGGSSSKKSKKSSSSGLGSIIKSLFK